MDIASARSARAALVLAGVLSVCGGPLDLAAVQATPPERLSVPSDGHPMAVWARRPATPRGSLLLVHGRTWSSRPDFDLQVPGLKRSVMSSLSEQGFAAYAVDLRGYGETRRDATGWLTPRRAAADIVNVLAWVAQQHPNLPRPALVGWSRGAAAAMLAAQTAPQRLSALVLFGFAYDPDQEFAEIPTPDKPLMAKNTAAAAASDFVSPKVTPKAVIDAFIAQALRADPITMDLKNDGEFNVLNPAKIMVPTLMLYGEHDINVPDEEGSKFFARLGTPDKQMVQLAGADHAAQLEDTHDAWIAAVVNFLTRPPARR
jgi:pimeloyl-ACP methyl ester carboxylesterase